MATKIIPPISSAFDANLVPNFFPINTPIKQMTNVTNGELYFCNNKNGSHYFNNDDDLIIKGVGNTKEV